MNSTCLKLQILLEHCFPGRDIQQRIPHVCDLECIPSPADEAKYNNVKDTFQRSLPLKRMK